MMRPAILAALDDISSSRSSVARRARALTALERVLARICAPAPPHAEHEHDHALAEFRRLQDAFETNIATRILSFLALSLPALDHSTASSPGLSTPSTPSRSSHSHSRSHSHSHVHSPTPDASLTTSVCQSLAILQGLAFLHAPSKAFLGRKPALQLLLDILLLSRPHHAPLGLGVSALSQAGDPGSASRTPSSSNSGPTTAPSPVPLSPLDPPSPSPAPPSPPSSALPLAALDTLLCILVDAPRALRAFEDASGLESVVRTLKRAGVPRDVRMRCLEFLYFYLLPETAAAAPTPPGSGEASGMRSGSPTPVPNAASRALTPPSPFPPRPATPRPAHSHLSPNTLAYAQPQSQPRSSTPVPDLHAIPQLTSSRSSSASSASSVDTAVSASVVLTSRLRPDAGAGTRKAHMHAHALANDELDRFVPATPKKPKLARIGMGTPRYPNSNSTPDSESNPASIPTATSSHARSHSHSQSEAEAQPPPVERGRTAIPALSLTTPSKGEKDIIGMGSGSGSGMHGLGFSLVGVGEREAPSRGVGVGADWEGEGEGGETGEGEGELVRTTEEKKARLGAWLGNVDQLVEGVGRAGLWGLV